MAPLCGEFRTQMTVGSLRGTALNLLKHSLVMSTNSFSLRMAFQASVGEINGTEEK